MSIRKAAGIATGVATLALLGAGLVHWASERAQLTESLQTLEQLRSPAGPDAQRAYRLALEIWQRENATAGSEPDPPAR